MARLYYIYLTEKEWVEAWEKGGTVPINPASAYVSDIREGTRTPDETLQRTIRGMPDWVVGAGTGRGPFRIQPGGGLTIQNIGIQIGDGPVCDIADGHADCRFEDGLILSLSTELDGKIAHRLGKKACVRIRCMACLIEALDEQLGVSCRWGAVHYRDGYARNHFLKSAADAWQKEYRLLWLTDDVQPRAVVIPPNSASRVLW